MATARITVSFPDPDEVVRIIDAACWTARRRYGHDDNGLPDHDTGEDAEDDVHPEAREAAAAILALASPTPTKET